MSLMADGSAWARGASSRRLSGRQWLLGDKAAFVMISHKKNRKWRQCLACRRHAAQTPPLESILAIVDVLKEKIVRGTSISEIKPGEVVTTGSQLDPALSGITDWASKRMGAVDGISIGNVSRCNLFPL